MQYAAEQVNVKGAHVWGHGLSPDMATVSSRPYRAAATACASSWATRPSRVWRHPASW